MPIFNRNNKARKRYLRSVINRWVERIIIDPLKISMAVFLILACAIVYVTVLYGYYSDRFRENLMVEAHGVLLDVLILGVVIVWLQQKGNTKVMSRHYQDEIDDFRNWKSEEAARRIRGNIKRLNQAGRSEIDISNCFLQNMDLRETNFTGANIWRSDLSYADVRNSIIADANLEDTKCTGASFSGSYFHRSVLWKTSLENADLRKCRFVDTDAREARFESADLEDADFTGADLSSADFGGSNLWRADFTGARLDKTRFTDAYMREAVLTGTKKISAHQLVHAQTLFDAQLPDRIRKKIQSIAPQLLEDPEKYVDW